MYINCKQCNKLFYQNRKDKIFCSKKCVYKNYNDRRPRKTNKSYSKARTLKGESISKEKMSIIYGTLLGDSSLILQTDGFHRLSLCHCEKQLDYLLFKKQLLNEIFLQDNVNRYNNNGNIQYHTHSISHPSLTNIYGIFYRNKKRYITRRGLNLLDEDSLLFWYLDDGSYIKSNDSIIICTDSYTLSEVKGIKKWFWQKFNIEVKILPVKGVYGGDRMYYRIRLNKKPSFKFLSLLSHSQYFNGVPLSIRYKFNS